MTITPEQLNKLTQLKDIVLATRQIKAYADGINNELSGRLDRLAAALNTLIGTDDSTQAIDTFNEVMAFLDGISGTTLAALLSTIRETTDSLQRSKQDVIADLDTIRMGASAGSTAYQKPVSGVPASDMSQGVRDSLGRADTSYQKPGGGIPSSDLAGNIPSNKLSTAVQNLLTAASTALQPDDLDTLNAKVAALESLVKADSGATINKFNEIVNFLAGISQYDTLEGLLADLAAEIDAKYSKPLKGIPERDLSAGVQASLLRADASYQKPGSGIPKSDLDEGVKASLGKADTGYQKPKAGIPGTDMTLEVQNLLEKAGTSYQKPSSGIPKSDLSSAVRSLLTLAGTAYQRPDTGIPSTDLTASVQALLIAAGTALQPEDLNTLNGKVAALEALVSEDSDPTAAIDKFSEIVAFLSQIENTETLAGILADINTAIAAKYTKPNGGIPKSDLDEGVQESLEKADTALQFEPDPDPSEAETADELARVLNELYQALDDAQSVITSANNTIEKTNEAKAAALSAADTAAGAAENADEKARAAQQAADNANAAMNAAKGPYASLSDRLAKMETDISEELDFVENDDPASLFDDDSSE